MHRLKFQVSVVPFSVPATRKVGDVMTRNSYLILNGSHCCCCCCVETKVAVGAAGMKQHVNTSGGKSGLVRANLGVSTERSSLLSRTTGTLYGGQEATADRRRGRCYVVHEQMRGLQQSDRESGMIEQDS